MIGRSKAVVADEARETEEMKRIGAIAKAKTHDPSVSDEEADAAVDAINALYDEANLKHLKFAHRSAMRKANLVD
jgi:hypothetical protein